MNKYESYKVVVVDEYGKKYFSKINNNYSKMLKIYKHQKLINKNKNVEVKFSGILNNIENELFSKIIRNKKTSLEILEELANGFAELENRIKSCSDLIALTDKQQNIILHKIENIEENCDDKDKIDFVESLKEIRIKRRKIKDEFNNLSKIKSVIIYKNNKGNINNYIQNFISLKKEIDNTTKVYDIKQDKTQKVDILRCSQNCDNQHMNQLKRKYNKVIFNEEDEKLYCYNNCGKKKYI